MARQRPGFTLVELIISLSVFAVLMGTIFFTFGQEVNMWDRLVSTIEGEQIGTMVISKITTDIKSADQILPGSDKDKLLLKIGLDTIEYSLYKNKVRRKKNKYSSYLTDVGDISTLVFSYLGNNLVKIKTGSLSTTVFSRN